MREVESGQRVRELWDALRVGGHTVESSTFNGLLISFSDGTLMGIRKTARTTPGEPTLEIWPGDGGKVVKVHVAKEAP
ncbi:hypothetical protein [Actinoalloteichus caeruleus]|uniref:hypothetical protein n=1 Tax=Actinoalloteichus cyanogriseus TaxID=2893586 RepID=UPI0004AB5FD7|nr:hypothetical protein [Actinoalloteichus caeruleus]